MTRTGKIARLPRDVREQLNRRLQNGEPGIRLVEWLNGLPQVQQNLAESFGGRDISEQNLSEWKTGGYRDWLAHQECLACARELAGDAGDFADAAGGSLADHLAMVMAARYAKLMSGWSGELDDEFRRQVRALRMVCQDIVELRRGDHFAERLKLDAERLAEAAKEDSVRALEVVLDETRQWPEVREAFRAAFELYRQRRGEGESDSIKPNQTESPPDNG